MTLRIFMPKPPVQIVAMWRLHSQWNWGNGANLPNRAYLDKFYNRTVDMINQYDPDAVYFDDTGLPFWQFDNVGLNSRTTTTKYGR